MPRRSGAGCGGSSRRGRRAGGFDFASMSRGRLFSGGQGTGSARSLRAPLNSSRSDRHPRGGRTAQLVESRHAHLCDPEEQGRIVAFGLMPVSACYLLTLIDLECDHERCAGPRPGLRLNLSVRCWRSPRFSLQRDEPVAGHGVNRGLPRPEYAAAKCRQGE